MIYCSKCGKKNKDDTKFCIYCGTPLKVDKKDKTSDKDEDLTPALCNLMR